MDQEIYPEAFSCSNFADLLASKNRSCTSSISSRVISTLPLVLANTQAGVSNCTQYLKLVFEPTSPRYASAYGDSLML